MLSPRKIAVVAIALAGGLALTAGGCEETGTRDAPINTGLQDNQAPFIVNMPNGYMNLALKCLGGDLVIASTREAPPVVIADATACAEGRAEELNIPRIGGASRSR